MEAGFAECGLDIIGCFPIADGPRFTPGQVRTRKELNVRAEALSGLAGKRKFGGIQWLHGLQASRQDEDEQQCRAETESDAKV